MGAALHAWHVLLGKPRKYVMEHAYLGQESDEEEIRGFLNQNNIPYKVEKDEDLLSQVVDVLAAAKVVGWFQGRFEWGPRALGHRSILADPRRGEMKQIVNSKIKFREAFRPFAPMLPEKYAGKYFEGLPGASVPFPCRFMQLVLPWRDNAANLVPAVNHVGTGRLQTVRPDWNPRCHRLLQLFEEATGVPILMNTSFNLRGEPIVASVANAWDTFKNSGLDVLVLGNCVIRK